MKKVLIGLDYNPTAQKIAETGFSLAKAMGAEVLLIHVISDPAYYSSTAYSPIMGFGGYMGLNFSQSGIIDELKKASEDFLDQSKKHLGDTSIQTLVKEGDVAEIILDVAKESGADMIVLGSHSQKWLSAIIMGSATQKVLYHSPIPLLIIPTKKQNSL